MSTAKRERDPRLDFFRGVAMLIIFIAHVPWNKWANYIPARFGFSDAAEMFVFCSGFAVAIAFGSTYLRAGFWQGTARILYRCWQLFAAHLGLFFFVAVLLALGNHWFDNKNYIDSVALGYLFDDTAEALIGLFTLTWVPNYFDIIPMYIGVLLMVPVVMILGGVHRYLAIGAVLAMYLANWYFDGGLPADPRTDREWFFNPLGWSLIFFSGFAFSIGWIKVPDTNRALVIACLVFVIAVIPFAHWPIWREFAMLKEGREVLKPLIAKTDFGVLRWLHFLALGYLAICLVRGREHLLHRYAKPILVVGQQSLPVFLLSMWMAQGAGMLLDQIGRSNLNVALVNAAGLAILVGFAHFLSWFKSSPWRQRKPRPAATAGPARPRMTAAMQPAE